MIQPVTLELSCQGCGTIRTFKGTTMQEVYKKYGHLFHISRRTGRSHYTCPDCVRRKYNQTTRQGQKGQRSEKRVPQRS